MIPTLERARSGRPVNWLTLLGILLLPAVVGGILVAALYNPTERLDRMSAAIVNLDEPVTIDGQYTPLGRQLAAGLVDGADDLDSNLAWVISNEADAAAGLAEGRYQAIVTIPREFSAAATSTGQALSGAETTPVQAEITVVTAPDGRVADDLITGQIAAVATRSMGELISEATLGNVFVGFATIGDRLGEAGDGAAELAAGARDAAAGAAEIPDAAQQLSRGAGELSGGAARLGEGLDQLADGAQQAVAGAGQLARGLTDGAAQLERDGIVPAALTQASTGAAAATSGVSGAIAELADDLAVLAASCPADAGAAHCARVAELAQTAAGVTVPADQAAQAAAGTSAGLAELSTAAPAAFAAQLRDAGAAASGIAGGLDQLATGAQQSAAGARALETGARGLRDGAAQLGDGAGELADGIGLLAEGTDELAEGLELAVASLPSFDDEESEALSAVLASPVTSDAGATAILGRTAIPLLATVVLWFGGLATFVALRAAPGGALTSRRSSAALAGRALWPAALIGAGQGVLVALIAQAVARYDAAAWWGFLGFAVLAGIVFAAVNQALVAVFGGAGRWASALVGVLAVATGIVSTLPGWLAGLGGMLPTASALNGLIAASGSAASGLVVWGVLAFAAATLATAARRTTTAKAVLAAA